MVSSILDKGYTSLRTLNVIEVYLNLPTGHPFQIPPICSLSPNFLLSWLSKSQSSSVFIGKKYMLISAAFKALHNLTPISIQVLILPTFSCTLCSIHHKFLNGPFQPLFPLCRMLSPTANSQSVSKIQFSLLLKHFPYAS